MSFASVKWEGSAVITRWSDRNLLCLHVLPVCCVIPSHHQDLRSHLKIISKRQIWRSDLNLRSYHSTLPFHLNITLHRLCFRNLFALHLCNTFHAARTHSTCTLHYILACRLGSTHVKYCAQVECVRLAHIFLSTQNILRRSSVFDLRTCSRSHPLFFIIHLI